jgi:hypothetical protein
MKDQSLDIDELDLRALVDFFGTLLEWSSDIIIRGDRNEREMYNCK